MKRKILRISLIFVLVILANLTVFVSAGYKCSEYGDKTDSIYNRVDSKSFSYGGSSYSYSMYLGVGLKHLDDENVSIHSDSFIQVNGDEYLVNDVRLIYTLDIEINGTVYSKSGSVTAGTSISTPVGDQSNALCIHSFKLNSFNISLATFPADLNITFEYEYISYELFTCEGDYTTSTHFTGEKFGIPGAFLGTIIVSLATGLLICGIIIKKTKKNAREK